MKAYWCNEIEESHGEEFVLSKARSLLLRQKGSSRINSDIEFEQAILLLVNKGAQESMFERLKQFTSESHYWELKEDIALEPIFFGEKYYANLISGLPDSKIEIEGIIESRGVALLGEVLSALTIDNQRIEPWSDEYIVKLIEALELDLVQETLERKHL